jgi:hypothetical protein
VPAAIYVGKRYRDRARDSETENCFLDRFSNEDGDGITANQREV